MTPKEIIKTVTTKLDGVKPKSSWGETSLFYNPKNTLPHGVYFCTIKEKDGENDRSSNLFRENVYRLSIGIPKNTYTELFGEKPKRPNKGGIVNTGHDFAQVDTLMPHPIYAWMSWVCILSPQESSFNEIYTLIEKAHNNAVVKFNKKIKKS